FKDLNLTEEQKSQLKGLRDLSKEERQARLKEILTPEQYAQLEARMARGKERRERLANELGLSEEQRQQMREAMAQLREETQGMSREERRALAQERLKGILTPEQFQKLEQLRSERRGKQE
ncbi:MAG: hypothetical protein AB1758_37225, partial [Candidatus Eremiobacterota bacterium]